MTISKAELASLSAKSVSELLSIYRDVFERPSSSRHKQHLVRQILWGRQANGVSPLSPQALRRVAELVDPRDLSVGAITAQVGTPPKSRRTPIPGTVLNRLYKGEQLEVRVLDDGFEFGGRHFGSLSAIAKHVTGSHWNGNLFFGISPKRPKG